ncbi:MAG: hypothetical protein RL490_1096 [Pseudomonadota bacterium]|jgi:uncharacterized protein (TIGR00369 family)
MPMTDEELLQRMRTYVPPTAILLGQELLSVDSEAGEVKMRFRVGKDFCNPMGNVQGGILVAMLDDAAAVAAIVKSGKRIVVPTIELKTSFMAPAKANAWLYATGRCIKLGRSVAFMEAELTDETGKLIAKLTTSCLPQPMPDGANMVERS